MYAANYSLVFPCQSNDLAMGTSEHARDMFTTCVASLRELNDFALITVVDDQFTIYVRWISWLA